MKRLAQQFGPPPWTWPVWLRYIRLVTLEVFWKADTTSIRALLAGGSVFFAIGLYLPLNTFARPGFQGMALVAGENTWATLLMLHAVGVWWRIYDPVSRPGVGFAVNAFGIGLWMFSTALIYYAVGKFSPTTGLECAVVMAAFVALLRTGFNDEVAQP